MKDKRIRYLDEQDIPRLEFNSGAVRLDGEDYVLVKIGGHPVIEPWDKSIGKCGTELDWKPVRETEKGTVYEAEGESLLYRMTPVAYDLEVFKK